jgi:hypothetical protein
MITTLLLIALAQPPAPGVQLKYLGTAGWEIRDGTTVVLIDPYLSRLKQVTPNDDVLPAAADPRLRRGRHARVLDSDWRPPDSGVRIDELHRA